MKHQISISDEELSELDVMLVNELAETRGELRHTRNRAYRKQVSHHLQLVKHIHDRVEQEMGVHASPVES